LDAKNQSRSDASDAYYRPIAGKRDNFDLITGQTVTKINFNKKKEAISVNVSKLRTNIPGLSDSSAALVHISDVERKSNHPYRQGEPRNHPGSWRTS